MKKIIVGLLLCSLALAGCANSKGSTNSGSPKIPIKDLTTKTNKGQVVFKQRKYTLRLAPGKINSQKKIDDILQDRNFLIFNEKNKDDLKYVFTDTQQASEFDYNTVQYIRYNTKTKRRLYNLELSAKEMKSKNISYFIYPNDLHPTKYKLKWSSKCKAIILYEGKEPESEYQGTVLPDGTIDMFFTASYSIINDGEKPTRFTNKNKLDNHDRYVAFKPKVFKFELSKD